MKTHLVIQGPMHSYFTDACPPNQAPDTVLVQGRPVYVCRNNVLETVRTYGAAFDTLTLCTWDNEPLDGVAQLEAEGVRVVALSAASVAALPNSLKQVVGVTGAIDGIPGLMPEDRILKTRNDIQLDLRQVLAHAEHCDATHPQWRDAGQSGLIHAPHSLGPFNLGDMVVTARADDFRRFWEASLPDGRGVVRRSAGIHETLPTEYLWKERERLRLSVRDFTEYCRWLSPWVSLGERLKSQRMWWRMLLRCFCLMPALPPEQFAWRGLPSVYQASQGRLQRYQMFEEWRTLAQYPDRGNQLTDVTYLLGKEAASLRARAMFARACWLTRLHVHGYHQAAEWLESTTTRGPRRTARSPALQT